MTAKTSTDAHRQNDKIINNDNYPSITKGRYRSHLGRARGWGSAKSGVHHWWTVRVSALGLIPLSIWFVYSVVHRARGAQIDVVEWLQYPVNGILMTLFVATGFYHGATALQTVYEDYVGREWLRMSLLILTKFTAILLTAASLYAIFFMSFFGGVQ